MKTLSIRQPWAWLIVNGYKDIENRTWATEYRGPLLIHAGKGMTWGEYEMCAHFVRAVERATNRKIPPPPATALHHGGIVGIAMLEDCVWSSESPWFTGPIGWRLSGAGVLPFTACRGTLRLFDCERPVVAPERI